MPEIPAEAVRAVAVILRAWEVDQSGEGDIAPVAEFDADALELLTAAAPHLGLPARKPRMSCPVCTRDVVRRDNGTPTQHYPLNHDPALTCGGRMYSYCKGSCRCRKCRAASPKGTSR